MTFAEYLNKYSQIQNQCRHEILQEILRRIEPHFWICPTWAQSTTSWARTVTRVLVMGLPVLNPPTDFVTTRPTRRALVDLRGILGPRWVKMGQKLKNDRKEILNRMI